MTTTETHRTEACVEIAAPAEDVYRLLTDVVEWPLLYPWIAHTEVLEREPDGDLVQFWAVKPDGSARIWSSRRTLDARALRMDFEQLGSVGPIDALGGTWVFHPRDDGGCRVETRHWFTTGQDPEQVAGELDRNSERQLGVLRTKAERRQEFASRVLRVEQHRELAHDPAEAHARLRRALDAPAGASAEFTDVTRRGPSGGTHTSRTLRIVLPGHAVIEQELTPPDPLELCLRRWRVAPSAGGTTLTASMVLSSPQADRAEGRDALRTWAAANLAASLAAVRSS